MIFSRKTKIYEWALLAPKTILGLCLFASLLSFFGARQLRIGNIFTNVLPENTESVQNLKQLNQYFGEMGFLVVVVEDSDPKKAQQFAEELTKRLEENPGVHYVDYQRPTEFFKKRKWLYFEKNDLEEMEKRVDWALQLQSKGVHVFVQNFLNVLDTQDLPDLTFKDIFGKYEKQFGFFLKDTEKSKSPPILWIKAKYTLEDLEQTRDFVSQIQTTAESIRKNNPDFSTLQLGYTGKYQTSIEEVDFTKKEITWASLIVFALLLLILLFYFRRLDAVFLVSIPLICGVLWTGGITYLIFGHLNLLTSFAGSILAGLGSDYGIYLLSRYFQERNEGEEFTAACHKAFGKTGKAIYISMFITIVAFAGLIGSDFRVFVEFGAVGAIGLAATYLAMMLTIPAFLALGQEWQHNRKIQKWTHWTFFRKKPWFVYEQSFLDRFFRPQKSMFVIAITAGLCGIMTFSLPDQAKIQFEDGQINNLQLPSNVLYERVIQITEETLNPTVLILNSLQEDNTTVHALQELLNEENTENLVYSKILGLSSFVPQDQEEKREILNRFHQKIQKLHFPMPTDKENFLTDLENSIQSDPITATQLPPAVRKMFESPHQSGVLSAYLFPSIEQSSVEAMKKYQEGLQKLKDKLSLSFQAVDGSFIAADAVRLAEKETLRGMIVVLFFLTTALLIFIRPRIRSLLIFLNLMGGMILLSGILLICKIPFNMINIAALPIILGTGIDCFFHLSYRHRENGNIFATVRSEVPPILISNITSIIGFGGLLLTSNSGLRSVGWVAVIGLAIITLLCTLIFPRCLRLAQRKSNPVSDLEEECA